MTSPDRDPVTAWAEQVEAGRIVAGPHVRNAARRHLTDLEDGPKRGLVWDREAANRVIEFFPRRLRLNGGRFEGTPFHLHASQAFRVGSLFGWKRKEDGRRRFRRMYDEEGKGNGKSPMLAGIGLYGMVADGEPRAEIYAAGSKKEQAHVLFQDAVAMVQQSPGLTSRIRQHGVDPVWQLSYRGRQGDRRFFKPIARDDGQSGPRPHMGLCDEVHEHRDRYTIDMLERGFKFRENPLLAMATNSGTDRNSICYEEHRHAIRVAAGEVEDDTTFAFVCSLDEGDDWLNDPECWGKPNPLLDVTIETSYLAGVVAQARAIPGKMNGIARLHFCVWTEAETVWIARHALEACEDPELTPEEFEGREAYGGLDLGATRDMTARAVVWPDGMTADGKPKFALHAHGYTPAETLAARVEEDKAPYDVWANQGYLTPTPGQVVRFDHVAADVAEDAQRFDLRALAYDVWLYRRFEEELDGLGLSLPVVEHPQGYNRRKDSPLFMPDSIAAFEELVYEKRLRIAVNPALRSAIMSVAFDESPAGLRRFTKRRATARIDLAVAAVMAVGAAVAGNEPEKPSVYETRGFLMV